jgi:putative membrane protein
METITVADIPFHLHPDIIAVAVGLPIAYWYAIRRLGPLYAAEGDPPVTRRKVAWFAFGMISFAVVEGWPFHDIAEQSLFSVHMIEHLVLTLVVPPALLKGMPEWLLGLLVRPVLPVVRFLTRPLIALVAFNATLGFLHAPTTIELMLTSDWAHFGLHAVLIMTAFFMWWPVIGPIPEIPKLSPFPAMGYLFGQSLVPTIPASFLTFADDPVYPVYETLPRLWGIGVMDDQLVAGLLMKIGGGLLIWGVITWIFFTWAAEEDRAAARRRRARVVRSAG